MNQNELIAAIAARSGLPKTSVAEVLRQQAELIMKQLAGADEGIEDAVPLPGLGKLKTGWREPRKGRNPATGEPLLIEGRVTVRFVPSKPLKQLLKA